tara:strand:- start:483 stop:1481 length:999 start_codon:yes stop_codon:yes gene_type:complete
MENAWAVGTITEEFLTTSKQLGVKNIIHYGGPGQIDWIGRGRTYEEYKEVIDTLKSNGLNLVSFEGGFVGNPYYWDIFAGGPKRDEQIEDLIRQIRDMARAGVPAYGYNWMPLGWVRSDPKVIRGNASATAFNINDKNLVYGGKKEIESIGDKYELTKESMWKNLEYWIKAVTPVAEEEGIRLGIHPDDPPVENLGGVPRIMTNFDAFKRLIEIYPSDSNAIEFCQGTFSEMDEDIYEMIEYFASRNKILYVHFRNVSAPTPDKFHEEFINTGYVDMVKAMKTYKDAGYKGCFMDDHCPDIYNDQEFPGNLGGYRSRIFAQGYIQGLLDAIK